MTGTYRQLPPPLHPKHKPPYSTSLTRRPIRPRSPTVVGELVCLSLPSTWPWNGSKINGYTFMRLFLTSSNNGLPWNERLESQLFVVSLVGLLFILSLMYSIYVQYIFCPPPLPLPLRANPSLIFASAPIHLFTSSTNPPAAPKEEERRGRRKVVRKEMIFYLSTLTFGTSRRVELQILDPS